MPSDVLYDDILTEQDRALIGILRHEKVARKAVAAQRRIIDNPILVSVQRAYIGIIWLGLYEYYLSNGYEDPIDKVVAVIETSLCNSLELTQSDYNQAVKLLGYAVSSEFILSEEDATEALMHILNNRSRILISNSIARNESLQSIVNACTTYNEAISEVDEQTEDWDFVRDQDELSKSGTYFSTHIDWLDEVTGGGASTPEVWLLLASTGGGKTIMSTQLALTLAFNGVNTMWCTMEQPFDDQDMDKRMKSFITGVDKTVFDSLPSGTDRRSVMTKEQLNDYMSFMRIAQPHLFPAQFCGTGKRALKFTVDGGFGDIEKQIERWRKNKNWLPKVIVVDWLDPVVKNVKSFGNRRDGTELTIALEQIDKAVKIAQKYNLLVFITHQLSTDAASKPPSYLAGETDIYMYKDVRFKCTRVFTIGTTNLRDPVHCYFGTPKNRGANKSYTILHKLGQFSRFDKAVNHIEIGGKFYDKEECGDVAEDTAQQYQRS